MYLFYYLINQASKKKKKLYQHHTSIIRDFDFIRSYIRTFVPSYSFSCFFFLQVCNFYNLFIYFVYIYLFCLSADFFFALIIQKLQLHIVIIIVFGVSFFLIFFFFAFVYFYNKIFFSLSSNILFCFEGVGRCQVGLVFKN